MFMQGRCRLHVQVHIQKSTVTNMNILYSVNHLLSTYTYYRPNYNQLSTALVYGKMYRKSVISSTFASRVLFQELLQELTSRADLEPSLFRQVVSQLLYCSYVDGIMFDHFHISET